MQYQTHRKLSSLGCAKFLDNPTSLHPGIHCTNLNNIFREEKKTKEKFNEIETKKTKKNKCSRNNEVETNKATRINYIYTRFDTNRQPKCNY